MQLYEQFTQFRSWHFTDQDLHLLRQERNRTAIEAVRASRSEENEMARQMDSNGNQDEGIMDTGESADAARALSAEDELKLCWFYEDMLPKYSAYFEFPIRVKATAMVYLKRFYLKRSVMEYGPQDIMITCLFLATKTENYYISADSFVKRLRGLKQFAQFESETILRMEWVVTDALHFHFLVHHPYLALHGIFLDAQAFFDAKALPVLQQCYESAITLTDKSYFTDVLFLYQPSQIAMAMFALAAQQEGISLEESYIAKRFEKQSEEEMSHLLITLNDIRALVQGFQPPSKEEVKEIDRRLYFWRNPLSDSNSLLYKRKKEKEEQDQIRQKKAKQAASSETHSAEDFFAAQ